MENKICDFWLCNLPDISREKKKALLSIFYSSEAIYKAKETELIGTAIVNWDEVQKIQQNKREKSAQVQYEEALEQGIRFVSMTDKEYPENLLLIEDSPLGLFYRGHLPDTNIPSVAIVGARNASREGRALAKQFGEELAANGIQVISGLARGIDVAAQRGALEVEGGKTYGFLGTGVDICYPRQHIETYFQMQRSGGGVISEFPLGTPALPYHFPLRNRLISGISSGILVIEARIGSGSLITAEYGMEQGKEIFVVPGSVGNPLYEGGNAMLKDGAVLVTETKDILDGLGIFLDKKISTKKKKTNLLLETSEKIVYAILSLEPVHVSEIVELSGIGTLESVEVLLSLQKKGLVQCFGNNYYALKV